MEITVSVSIINDTVLFLKDYTRETVTSKISVLLQLPSSHLSQAQTIIQQQEETIAINPAQRIDGNPSLDQRISFQASHTHFERRIKLS